MSLWSFQGARELEPALHEKNAELIQTRSLKTQQRTKYNVEVDVLLGELNSRTEPRPLVHQRVRRLPE